MPMKSEVCILCCRNLQPELELALKHLDIGPVRTVFFDPHTNDPGVQRLSEFEAFDELGEDCGVIMVLGCGCWYAPQLPRREGADTVLLGRGAELFLPPSLVMNQMNKGSYMVTPGWLMGWRSHIEREEDNIRELLSDTVKEIVLLDTGTRPEAQNELEAFAARMGLPSSTLPTGVDNLRLLIDSGYNQWRCEKNDELSKEAEAAKRRAADYAMVFDLLGEITVIRNESDLVDNVVQTYTLLFSPQEVRYLAFDEHGRSAEWDELKSVFPAEDLRDPAKSQLKHPDGEGFIQFVSYKQTRLGAIIVGGLTFPGFIDEYLSTSQFISGVLGLAIHNSRTYDMLNKTIKDLEVEVRERMRAETGLATANEKLNLLGSITRHDTLNQITVIQGYLDLLEDIIDDERMMKYKRRMESAVDCVTELITFAREYEMIGMGGSEWIRLDDVLTETGVESVEMINRCQGLELYADPMLDKVFYNLMDNSIRHSGGRGRVTVSSEESDGCLLLRWEDEGEGVPYEEKQRIFERGVGKNTGLGLFLIKEILRISGMSIVENGVPGEGACFEIRVPEGMWTSDP